MVALSVRDLDETVRERLRVRAARHGRSMEAEIRAILTESVSPPNDPRGLAQTLLARSATSAESISNYLPAPRYPGLLTCPRDYRLANGTWPHHLGHQRRVRALCGRRWTCTRRYPVLLWPTADSVTPRR